MGYEITITRDPPLTLAGWRAAILSIEGARIDSSGASVTNPSTSEAITMKGRDGDAKIRVDGYGEWIFMWRSDGEVVFSASDGFENPKDPVRLLARKLSVALGASMIGEEGEEYS